MAKSTGNSFIMSDIEAQGIDPMAFRYLCMTARYNTRLNFTFTSLRAAQRGLQRLRNRIWRWTIEAEEAPDTAQSNGAAIEQWTARFFDTVNANLDLPGALALTWKLARADLPEKTKLDLIETFDEVLGLDLMSVGDDYEPDPESARSASPKSHPERFRRLLRRRPHQVRVGRGRLCR